MPNAACHDASDRLPRLLFTFDEALIVLRVSRRTLQSHVSAKAIGVVRIGRRVFFRLEDLDAFVRASRESDSTT